MPENHCFLPIRNSAGKWEHKIVVLLLVLPHYFKPNQIICQYMTHSLLKLEAFNRSYLSDCVFKLFPCYHWLLWGWWTVLLCDIFTDTACALCSVTLHHQASLFCSSTQALEQKQKQGGQWKAKEEKTKTRWAFLRTPFLGLPCRRWCSGSGSHRKPMTSQLLTNTTPSQTESNQDFLLLLSFHVQC